MKYKRPFSVGQRVGGPARPDSRFLRCTCSTGNLLYDHLCHNCRLALFTQQPAKLSLILCQSFSDLYRDIQLNIYKALTLVCL